jgi:hypothetical protein
MSAIASAKKYKALCEALEAERHDTFYLDGLSSKNVKTVTETLTVMPEKFKRVYFHAGRYSSGARDKLATQSWLEYELTEDL